MTQDHTGYQFSGMLRIPDVEAILTFVPRRASVPSLLRIIIVQNYGYLLRNGGTQTSPSIVTPIHTEYWVMEFETIRLHTQTNSSNRPSSSAIFAPFPTTTALYVSRTGKFSKSRMKQHHQPLKHERHTRSTPSPDGQ